MDYITKEEKDFIKSYTKNNKYLLNGLYNTSNIFNNYFLKYFKNTLELYNFIISNINKLDDIPLIDINNFNINNYPLCNNTSMIIDKHNKEDLFKFVIDIDIKYDENHININKYKSLDNINFDKLYKNIPLLIENIIEKYFDYNIDNIENEYINYVLKYDKKQLNSKYLNQYNYIWSNKINNNSNIHLYYPFIFVNQIQYEFIINKLVNKLNKINKDFIWNNIIDNHMKTNGFRLLYCNKPYYTYNYNNKKLIDNNIPHNPNYYLINYNKTTIKLNDNDKFHHLFITSMQTKYNNETIIIKNIYNDLLNNNNNSNNNNTNTNTNINNNNNNNKNKNKNKEIIKLENIKDENITNEINKLFNLLNLDRLNNYNDWINIIYLCHTYNLYSFCINFSNKTNKYNNNKDKTLEIINYIFTHNNTKDKDITFNTLFFWILKDNNIKYNKLVKLLNDNNIDIDKLNDELKYFNSNYYINNNLFTNNITINNLIKLNINDDIKYNNNFNYYEVENEFINDNDFNYIKDYNNLCIISPVGTGKTTIINKLIKYWNNIYLNNILEKYPNIKYLNDYDLNDIINKNLDNNLTNYFINERIEYYKIFNNKLIVNNNLNKYFNLSILFISSLISLGDKIYIDLKEFNIQNYKFLKYYEYNNYKNIIISLEQLYKLNNTYDIIIIDEITSFISRFLSKTNKNLSNNYFNLLKLCNNSKHIILLDALYREDTFLLTKKLFECNNFNSIFYYNKFKKCNNKFINNYFYDKKFNIINNNISFLNNFNINNNINNNNSILLCSDSINIINDIYDYYNKDKNNNDYYIKITKDEYNSQLISDCNNSFYNKFIMFSPKITYGIDIQINYDKIFGIYKGKSINSYLMLQQLSRCRKCNNINILSLFNNNNNKNICNYELFKYLYINNIKNNNDILVNQLLNKDLINNIDNLLIMDNSLNNKYKDIIDFLDIIIYNKYYDYITRNNKLKCLTLLCEYQGYTLNNFNLNNINDYNIDINKDNKINKDIILDLLKLKDNYKLINDDNIKNYIDDILSKKINFNRLLHSYYLFKYNFDIINSKFDNNNKDIIDLFNNNEFNNYKFIYKILINLNKELGINKFELLNEYNKDKLIKFINNNKFNIDNLFISKHKDKNNNNKNKSFNNLLNEINNDKFNNKLKCINGLYLFNQFILSCYKYIDNNLIISNNNSIRINKIRYRKIFNFNNEYIKNINYFYNINKKE